jgi:16S rRNA processing protein RimM
MASDKLILGRLGAPRGIKGDLRLQSYSGEFGHLEKLKTMELHAEGRTLVLKVLRLKVEADGATVAFEGYPTPEAARPLVGMEILGSREIAAPLGKDEWYVVDLVGLALKGAVGGENEGRVFGTVISIVEGGPDPWLEALLPDGRKSLVPFRNQYIGRVDIAGGFIELLVPQILE